MSFFTHILWVVSYLIIATFFGVLLHKGAGLELLNAASLGAIFFLLLTQLHAAIARRQERRDMQKRLMALYRDYQSALDIVDDTREAMALLETDVRQLTPPKKSDVISEMKILQMLLAQVVSRSGRGPTEAAKQNKDAARLLQKGRKGGRKAENTEITGPEISDSEIENDGRNILRVAGEDQSETGRLMPGAGGAAAEPESLSAMGPTFTGGPGLGARVVLDQETHEQILNIMHHALEENRIDLYLQPIVSLPSRRPSFYEAFSRVRDENGHIIFPRQYLPVAEESGLIGTLDNLLLFRCIQTIRRLGTRRPGVKFFCNISPASLEDDEFFPQFIDFMLNNAELTDRLVFEFAESDVMRQSADVRQRLNTLGQRGFAFSVDRVSDIRFNFPDLADRFIRYVKLDAGILMTQSIDLQPEDMKEALQRYGIELIVEKIEDEKTVLDVLDLGVRYGQGYLFGEPRLSREPGESAA